MSSQYIRIDCRKRSQRQVMDELIKKLAPARASARAFLVVANLREIEGSVAAFLKELARYVTSSGVDVSLVDSSGCASAFFGALPCPNLTALGQGPNPRRVLVVEDHEDSLEFLRALVEAAGHQCATARSAKEAIARIDSGFYDLVLLDLVLADSDGLQVAEHILARGLDLPVITLSAYLDRWDQQTFTRLKIRRSIAKPYRVKEILEALEAVQQN